MRRIKIFFFVFAVMLCLCLSLVPHGFSQSENIKILSYSWYTTPDGFLTVVGELQNVGANVIERVDLGGAVYVNGTESPAYSYTTAYVNYMIPEQKAPFYMEFSPGAISGTSSWLQLTVGRVDLAVISANVTDSYQYPDLAVKSSAASVDSDGTYWVTGTIQNNGTQSASTIRVIATFYNASGTVTAVGYTDPLTPASLAPAAIAQFQVGAFDLNQTENPQITSYALLIQTTAPILSTSSASTSPSTTSSPSPSTSPSASSSTSPSPTPSSSQQPTPSPTSQPNGSLTTDLLYIAVVAIVIVIISAIVLLRKRR